MDLERSLSETLEQQMATAAMLSVISRSPTDIQSVLEAIAESVARLCDSPDVTMFRVDRGILQLAVHRDR
jgi:two-component system, NtrC family, sensor kinase